MTNEVTEVITAGSNSESVDIKEAMVSPEDKTDSLSKATDAILKGPIKLVVEMGGYAVGLRDDLEDYEVIGGDRLVTTHFVSGHYPMDQLSGRDGPFAGIGLQIPVKDASGQKTMLGLPYGVTVLLGGAGSGKSELLSKIARYVGPEDFQYERFMEPEAPCITDPHEALSRVGQFLIGDKKVLGKDSARFYIFSPGRKTAAGQGGTNMALFTSLTALSVAAEMRRKVILLVVNPITNNTDMMQMYFEALSGSVNAVIGMQARGKFRFVARTEENDRTVKNYEVGLTQDDVSDLQDFVSRMKPEAVTLSVDRQLVSGYLNMGYKLKDSLK